MSPRIALVLWLVCVSTACSIPPPIAPRHDAIAWEREPTIATDTPALRGLLREAVAAWGWGRIVEDCYEADICVSRDAMEGGRRAWGRASWERDEASRCQADVMLESLSVVVHELGHCYGLGHSEDGRSLMHGRAYDGSRLQHITAADRAALGAIRDATASNRRAAARRARETDGWHEIRNARASAALSP